MARYFMPVLVVVALFLASACASGKEQEQQKVLLTTAVNATRAKMTKVPMALPRGMSPDEEERKLREIAEEEEMAREKFVRESGKTAAALQEAQKTLGLAKEKLTSAAAELSNVKKATNCSPEVAKDVPAQKFLAVSASANATCDLAKLREARQLESVKAAEVASAEKAVREAEQMLNDAQAMDTAAKTALQNSQYVAVPTPGERRGGISARSAGMGPRNAPRDGALRPTAVVVNGVFLLLIAHALLN